MNRTVASEPIKAVFWDLDGTLWSGTLEEDGDDLTIPVTEVRDALLELDNRGILNCIVSQASEQAAKVRLAELGLSHIFVRSRYGTVSKAQAIALSLNELNLLPSNAAFIDDLPFYRREVEQLLPDVYTLDPSMIPDILEDPRFAVVSALGPARRLMYQSEEKRKQAAEVFAGSRADFLASCDMILRCKIAENDDLPRLHELFIRAHRFNTTPSETGSENALADGKPFFCVGQLSDCFGDYGLIAGAKITAADGIWLCTNLAISCRVQGRGVVEAFLHWLVTMGKSRNSDFRIEVSTASEVNMPLRTVFRFSGFAPVEKGRNFEVLGLVKPERLKVPQWVKIYSGVEGTIGGA